MFCLWFCQALKPAKVKQIARLVSLSKTQEDTLVTDFFSRTIGMLVGQ